MPQSSVALLLVVSGFVGDAARITKHLGLDGQVIKCAVGPHTYINLGDGGCFQHLDWDGAFKDSAAAAAYEQSFCPFVDSTQRRMAFMLWHNESVTTGRPPFALNDLAMSCLLDDFSQMRDRYPMFDQSGIGDGWSNEEICETMLSLPLMFEAIGFDGAGLLMEDSRTRIVWSFKGRSVGLGPYRPGPTDGCDSMRASGLGPSRHGRLALRALLPTYFRHRYAESSNGMILKGARALLSPFTLFKKSYWKEQVTEICNAAASSETLKELYSFANLRAGKLVSQDAMDRDKGRCHETDPCNYAPDPEEHLGACDVCLDPDLPHFHADHGDCHSMPLLDSESETCADESIEKRTCECHKAICWYFTKDFKAAMEVAAKACKPFE